MIRIILFLVSLAVIAVGVGWIADRPGEVSVTWMGYRIETSLMLAFFAVVALVIVLMTVWWIISVICTRPNTHRSFSSIVAWPKVISRSRAA